MPSTSNTLSTLMKVISGDVRLDACKKKRVEVELILLRGLLVGWSFCGTNIYTGD
jgi:hypothetical protein